MFASSSRALWSSKSKWSAFCFLALILLNFLSANQMLSIRMQVGAMIQLVGKTEDSSSRVMDVTPAIPYPTTIIPEEVAKETILSSPEDEALPERMAPERPSSSPTIQEELVPAEQSIPEEESPTAWCVLHQKNTNTHFRHFPHALQSLAPCWSFFCRVRAERHNLPCGIFIHHPRQFPRWKDVSSWTRQLVEQYMGCRVVIQSKEDTPPIGNVILPGDVQYSPPEERKKPYIFFETTEHVRQLQARVLGDAVVAKRKGEILRIGLLQRIRDNPNRPSRIFLNLPEIRAALQTAFPNATVVETDMRNFSLRQQAQWWHQNDIVIAGHGAAITNGIFLRNHNHSAATVIEVYPDGFHPIIFTRLLKSVGVHHWTIHQNASVGAAGKSADLRPDPHLLVQLVQQALPVGDDLEETIRV